MRTTSTLAVHDPAQPGVSSLLVFDSFVDGKRLVTAVVLSSEDDPDAARLAKRTRDAALRHQRRGGGTGAHLVQPFDADAVQGRVEDVLAGARTGALVILFGRSPAECALIVDALGVCIPSGEWTVRQ
jgi:hypothetical protein